jgi:hypothetical protein
MRAVPGTQDHCAKGSQCPGHPFGHLRQVLGRLVARLASFRPIPFPGLPSLLLAIRRLRLAFGQGSQGSGSHQTEVHRGNILVPAVCEAAAK